ncbi:MAG: helicase C-terminal domain-containing protein [Armatimonadota bacterium]|nr:helicase C-terminal domain-containing protein [Armatimonadota bacterium]
MIEQILSLIGPQGRFPRLCPGYEYREEQLEMARAVAEALTCGRHLLVEAGTGVGKTVAYLAPAVLHALSEMRPVVVSTHTINLQGQLVNKDIPLMQQVMEHHPFKAMVMKGRANFLCLQELDYAASLVVYQGDVLFERLKQWAEHTETGDIAELDFVFPDWHELCSNQDTCRRQECPYYAEECFYYRMRRSAESADIVVVNHALFFTDLGLRMIDPKSAIIPDYCAVVFDEAHHLEDVASNTFGIEFSNYRVVSLLNRLRKRRDVAMTQGEYQLVQSTNDELFSFFSAVPKQEFFLEELYEFVSREAVENKASELIVMLDSMNTQLAEQQADAEKDLKDRIQGYRNILTRMATELRQVFFGEHDGYFSWVEKPTGMRHVQCVLHYSPVTVSDLLAEVLWGSIDSVICTSATLSTSGTFSYFKSRLGVSDCDELILGSPFDYRSQALLYVPDDLGDPSETSEYADKLSERIRDILLASQGRAFILFTSYRMMNAVFHRLKDCVPFRLLRQGEMSNERLIKEFREDDTTCLMGVHSFWEGVDVKGERLSCVIIDKLPFAVPDTPINKARCAQITREGGDWFHDYAIPQAQIKLRQGFGRLIRTKTDRGVVAILDSRIRRRYYGREFLKYLPPCRLTDSVEEIRRFLGT